MVQVCRGGEPPLFYSLGNTNNSADCREGCQRNPARVCGRLLVRTDAWGDTSGYPVKKIFGKGEKNKWRVHRILHFLKNPSADPYDTTKEIAHLCRRGPFDTAKQCCEGLYRPSPHYSHRPCHQPLAQSMCKWLRSTMPALRKMHMDRCGGTAVEVQRQSAAARCL
jgi:hypothetical protein